MARSRTAATPLFDRDLIADAGRALLTSLLPTEQGIRLLGLTLSGFHHELAKQDQVQPPLNFGYSDE